MRISQKFVVIVALFVTCLIAANVIAVKIVTLGGVVVPAAIFVFPVSYVFGDVLTEVYGYAWARRVIWLGFLCNLVFVLFVWIGQLLPPASFWKGQEAYASILGYAPRLLLASFAGYLVGEFSNSLILSRMKVLTKGRWLWSRTVGSTIVGEGLDTVIFISVAFVGTAAFGSGIMLNHWIAKVGIEILATPLTYLIIRWLKRTEAVDAFDRSVSLNPFSMRLM